MKKLLKGIGVTALAFAVCFSMFNIFVKADPVKKEVEYNGYHFELFDDQPDGYYDSINLVKYTGNETTIVLPTHIIFEGKKLKVTAVTSEAFANNTNIQKIIIPDGYEYIASRAFSGCTGLTEMVIGDISEPLVENALSGPINLRTYRLAQTTISQGVYSESGIGLDDNDNPISGVEAFVVRGSSADIDIQEINSQHPAPIIALNYGENDPASEAHVERVLPEDEPTTTTVPTTTKAGGESTEPSNPYEKGASYDKADKAITNYSSEKDVPGSVYGLLQLKQKKATKKTIKVGWKKVPGAVKYAYYATNCGPKNKYVKHGITTGTSFNYKKICGKKLKKASYYKFIVIAVDAKGKVVSTSKTVHVATKGGKVTNDKKVKVKKKKASIKVKKTFKIKAKEVTPKKGKVKRHRKIKYESLNTSVATVNGKGVVKGVKKGTTTVFAYAQNGFAGKVKITVK